jgi:hypothetical protein
MSGDAIRPGKIKQKRNFTENELIAIPPEEKVDDRKTPVSYARGPDITRGRICITSGRPLPRK